MTQNRVCPVFIVNEWKRLRPPAVRVRRRNSPADCITKVQHWRSFRQKNLPFRFRVMFYGISQCSARHFSLTRMQKRGQHLPIPLSDFPKHPAARLVNQIVAVRKKHFGKVQRIGKFVVANQCQCGHYRNALFPENRTFRQSIEVSPLPAQQVIPDNAGSGQIH